MISILSACSEDAKTFEKKSAGNEFREIEKTVKHLKNREDSLTWDKEIFQSDLSYVNEPQRLSFHSGVFPVPKYNLLGHESFKGVGNFGFPGGEGAELVVGNKKILFNSFFVNASSLNKQYLSGRRDEVFFQILVLTDFIDTNDYSHTGSEIISRNHPDYIGQGFYKTKNSKVDYTAFITADRNAYAIVNMRLFDLTKGKTILIAPQKDKSFRSLQINSPALSSETIEEYTKNLVKNPDVESFFLRNGNI